MRAWILTVLFLIAGHAHAQSLPADMQNRIGIALVRVCPQVAAQGADLSALMLAEGAVETRMPEPSLRRDGVEQSYTFSDAPGLYVTMHQGACGIALLEGDPVLNAATAATIVEMNKNRFSGGVVIMTATQLTVRGNAMAGFDMSLRGDDYRTAAWTWGQTVNTQRRPGRFVIMTLQYDRAKDPAGY